MAALTLVRDGTVAVVTLDLPGSPVNKFTAEVKEEFLATFDEIRRDPAIHAVVVISGKPDTFIAGADIEEFV
ncbi:MAG TPA: enoyl-CoA hydratase-related protein, partial [Vicinamibacterales bacterium]|nr:enoyl-CoA hydratase-related protein [Vicinamibacterales bacterium]